MGEQPYRSPTPPLDAATVRGMDRSAARLSLNDLAILGVIGEGQTHGWAVTQALAPDGPLGRIWTVNRPLVYRSIALLIERGLIVEVGAEPGLRGPQRVIVRISPSGRRTLSRWLERPVDHVREIRTEFLLKIAFLERSGRGSGAVGASAGRSARPRVRCALRRAGTRQDDLEDVLARWRFHSATAAQQFLAELAGSPRGRRAKRS